MFATAAYPVCPRTPPRPFIVRETPGVTPARPRLLDRVRAALRARHYSRRTEEGVRRVDQAVHLLLPRPAPSRRHGRAGGHSLSLLAGGGWPGGRLDPEPGPQSMVLVDKILKGAEGGTLPIHQASRFELVVNLKTAKTLRLTIPPSFLLRADRRIE